VGAAAFILRPVVALQHGFEADVAPAGLTEARDEVDRLSAGLSRALLAAPPDVVRAIAERARLAEAAVARWKARVGEPPALDDAAEAAVHAAVTEVQAARAHQNTALHDRHRILATGNGAGVLGLGVAGGLVLFGLSPMGLPVAVAVAASPIGPCVAGWLAAQRCSVAARRVGTARAAWSSALERAGATTMGELSARRVARAAWERRCREAEVAEETARPQIRAWYRLAGPGIPPTDVEDVIDRIEELRQAQLRLLGMLLSEVVERHAMDVLAPPAEVADPTAAPTWLEEALARFRGGAPRLRLFGL
jgi:chorismate mutase